MNWILKKWYLSKILLLFLLNVILIGLTLGQSEVEDLFIQANTDYQNGLVTQAIAGYKQILDSGIFNADIYYNLGCAYLKDDQLGLAILNFERAVELKPFNPEFRHNLKIARNLTKDDFIDIQGFFLSRWLENTVNLISSNGWATLSICLLIIAVAVILFWLFSAIIALKKAAFITGLSFFFLFGCSILFGRWKTNLETNNPMAIILHSEIPLLIAPDMSSKEILTIHEGLRVKIIDQIGKWYKVELTNKEVGWVQQANLERI